MKNYRLIGLTGATGAGKGEVSAIFAQKGYKVIYADSLAREIMDNPLVLRLLSESFGEDILCQGVLDRRLLAERAFKDKDTKNLLDKITHPFITALFISELSKLKSQGAQRILFDASQLFESGLDAICDAVISVTADESLRLKRIIERDGLTLSQAQKRMAVQFSEDFFRDNSDYIIENNSGFASLGEAVNRTIEDSEVRFGSEQKI